MIAACQYIGDGARSIATYAIGYQPFSLLSYSQIATNLTPEIKGNHILLQFDLG
jgi:hypothetical protein